MAKGLCASASPTARAEPFAPRTHPRRELAVRKRLARRNAARDHVDPAVERANALQVQTDRFEGACLAPKKSDDTVEGVVHFGWWSRFSGGRKTPQYARPGFRLPCFRELHADDPSPTPDDPATTDGRGEEGEAVDRRLHV